MNEERIREIVRNEYKSLATRFGIAKVPFHIHNGIDAPKISSFNLNGTIYLLTTIPGTLAATQSNWPTTVFIAPFRCSITGFREAHTQASVSGTLTGEILTGTAAPGAGTTVLTSTIDLSSAANTVNTGTLKGAGSIQMNPGDRFAIVVSGDTTNQHNVTIIISIAY